MTMREPDLSIARRAGEIHEAVAHHFGKDALDIVNRERGWYVDKLRRFSRGGSADF